MRVIIININEDFMRVIVIVYCFSMKAFRNSAKLSFVYNQT